MEDPTPTRATRPGRPCAASTSHRVTRRGGPGSTTAAMPSLGPPRWPAASAITSSRSQAEVHGLDLDVAGLAGRELQARSITAPSRAPRRPATHRTGRRSWAVWSVRPRRSALPCTRRSTAPSTATKCWLGPSPATLGRSGRDGGIGRRAGLKNPWASAREGSTPSPGTMLDLQERRGVGRRPPARTIAACCHACCHSTARTLRRAMSQGRAFASRTLPGHLPRKWHVVGVRLIRRTARLLAVRPCGKCRQSMPRCRHRGGDTRR